MYMWDRFGELAGTNIEIDLTLRKNMYSIMYYTLIKMQFRFNILTVLDYGAYISEEFQFYRIYFLSYNHCFVRWYVTFN